MASILSEKHHIKCVLHCGFKPLHQSHKHYISKDLTRCLSLKHKNNDNISVSVIEYYYNTLYLFYEYEQQILKSTFSETV